MDVQRQAGSAAPVTRKTAKTDAIRDSGSDWSARPTAGAWSWTLLFLGRLRPLQTRTPQHRLGIARAFDLDGRRPGVEMIEVVG